MKVKQQHDPRTDAELHKYCQDFTEITVKILAHKLKISYNILYAWWTAKRDERPRLRKTTEDAVRNWAEKRGFTAQEEAEII